MSFFAMMILVWLFFRFGRLHRMRRWHRGYELGWYPRRRLHRLSYVRPMPPAPAPKESAFEILKKRYVKGELTDDQYESELDRLLQTPEGRREVE